jgi:hypothetical protein
MMCPTLVSGVGLTGGKTSSSSSRRRLTSNLKLSVLRVGLDLHVQRTLAYVLAVYQKVLGLCPHTLGDHWNFQPKFFVQKFIGVASLEWLHNPVNSCLAKLIQRRRNLKTKFTCRSTSSLIRGLAHPARCLH